MQQNKPLTDDLLITADFKPWGMLGLRRSFQKGICISLHRSMKEEGSYDIMIHHNDFLVAKAFAGTRFDGNTIHLPGRIQYVHEFETLITVLTGENIQIHA